MYVKIFSQIYDSSIVENPEARFTFMDLLLLADRNGVVDMTHEAIARRTNRPLAVIRKTISMLEGPDPQSRTPEFSGARIKKLDDHRDWGWMILNYQRFREIASEEQRREKTLARVKKHRAKAEAEGEGKALTCVTDALQLPPPLNTPEIEAAWKRWEKHRVEKRQKLTPSAISSQIEKLRAMGPERALAAIEHSIQQGYTGLYESKNPAQPKQPGKRTLTYDNALS